MFVHFLISCIQLLLSTKMPIYFKLIIFDASAEDVTRDLKALFSTTGHYDVVKTLLDAGIDISAVDSDGTKASDTTDDQNILKLFNR